MVLPLAVRQAMGLHGDTKVIATIDNGAVTLSALTAGVERAQALYRAHATNSRSTEDFLQERAEDVAHNDRAG
ncbi:MAG: AbrB/MazE/SpoVT family DNA-binding domain-containing protein [Sphingomonas sp.]|nr:AbrB/MazE/SpoVT family DNA-binding domain-containing protein [Sphingomonas sp.]